jgi:hypothetical protein
MEQSSHDVFINLTLGARVRVSPPFTRLMDRITFILNTCQAIRVEGMLRNVGSLARSIRSTILIFHTGKCGRNAA